MNFHDEEFLHEVEIDPSHDPARGSNSDFTADTSRGDNSHKSPTIWVDTCSSNMTRKSYGTEAENDEEFESNSTPDHFAISSLNKSSDHSYSSSQTEADMVAWYCLGVA